MSDPLRLLFDECVGKPVMEEIAKAVRLSMDAVEFKHVLDFQKQGEWDETWIPKIASEGWIVITGDRGRRGGTKKGAKLPAVCKAHHVTHIVLGKAVHASNSIAKIAAILSVWPKITELPSAPKGSRHVLRVKGSSGAVVLVQIDPPLAPQV